MRFDVLRRRGGFGPEGPVETFNELGSVTRRSEERYEWDDGGPLGRSQLVVVRDASGPIPRMYDAPAVRHPSGVVEHRTKPARFPFDPQHALFVFPDGTWVRTQGDKVARVRETFASTALPPPPPAIDADVAFELCGAIDPNEVHLPFDVWAIAGRRSIVRLFGSRQEGELTYAFADASAAVAAGREQASRCARARCPWALASSIDGSVVAYDVVVRQAPTAKRARVEIAHVTPPLAAPPPPSAPLAPGTPASGMYQRFVDVRSDTCTGAAGRSFPSMMDLVLVKHDSGVPRAKLGSMEPRGRGMMTQSPMPDVELRPGAVSTKRTTHLCPGFAIERTMTVLAASGDTIRVRDRVRYAGSTAGCGHPHLPSACEHEVVTTWVLARKSCDGACDATLAGRAPGYTSGAPAPAVDVRCACPR